LLLGYVVVAMLLAFTVSVVGYLPDLDHATPSRVASNRGGCVAIDLLAWCAAAVVAIDDDRLVLRQKLRVPLKAKSRSLS